MASSQLIFVVLLAAFGFACSEDAPKQAPATAAPTKPTTTASNLVNTWYTPGLGYGGLGYGGLGYGFGLPYGGYALGGFPYGGYGLGLGYGYGGVLPGYGARSVSYHHAPYLGGFPGVATSSVTHHAPVYNAVPHVTSSVTHHAPYGGLGAGYLGGPYGGYLGLH